MTLQAGSSLGTQVSHPLAPQTLCFNKVVPKQGATFCSNRIALLTQNPTRSQTQKFTGDGKTRETQFFVSIWNGDTLGTRGGHSCGDIHRSWGCFPSQNGDGLVGRSGNDTSDAPNLQGRARTKSHLLLHLPIIPCTSSSQQFFVCLFFPLLLLLFFPPFISFFITLSWIRELRLLGAGDGDRKVPKECSYTWHSLSDYIHQKQIRFGAWRPKATQ